MCSTYFSYMLPSSPTIPISWPTDTAQPFLHLIYFAVCRKGIVISYVYLVLWFMWFCVSWMYPLVALWIHPMLHGCIHLLQHGHIHAIIWTHLDVSRCRHGCIHEPYFQDMDVSTQLKSKAWLHPPRVVASIPLVLMRWMHPPKWMHPCASIETVGYIHMYMFFELTLTLSPQKGNFQHQPFPGSEFNHFGWSNYIGMFF